MLEPEKTLSNVPPISNASVQIVQKKLKQSYPQFFRSDDLIWNEILESAEIVELPAGMLVLQPTSPCEQFMLLLDGSVRVYQQSPDDREVTLYRTNCGDLCALSLNGMLHRKDFGAFAKTETVVHALLLSRDQFMKAMARLPDFCEFVLVNLTDRINDVLQTVENTVFENLDTRLMCLLSSRSRETGSDTLHLTHQELARELGTSREVISRILKVFEKQKCIKQERGIINITM